MALLNITCWEKIRWQDVERGSML